MNALLATFVIEARELLQESGEDLLALERAPGNADAINRLFRSVHTLKGSSGLFDAQPLTKLLHALEDMFQAVRERGLALTPEMVDLSLQALDRTGQWIDQLDRDEVLANDADALSKTMVLELRTRFGRRAGEVLEAPPVAAAAAAPTGISRWFDLAARQAAVAARVPVHVVSYLPEEGCFFKGEDPLHLVLQVPQMQALACEPRRPWPELSALDPFNCNLAFHALTTAPRAALDSLFRYVPEQASIAEVAPEDLLGAGTPGAGAPLQAASPLAGPVARAVAALLREQLEMLAVDPAAVDPAVEFAGRVAAAARVATNALGFAGRDAAAAIQTACDAALAARATDALRAAIAGQLAAIPSEDVAPAPAAAPAAAPVARAAEHGERALSRTLRVDQEKIDSLMNLIAELVVAKNSLPFLARRAEQHFELPELGREIKDQYGVIDRITQELQGSVMAIRMMPIGQVFQRFPRLVRDLSRKLGKQVDLVIEGEATEADKNVIENLFDPLLHMVRNSLDHGVELPEERTARGKPATATVTLRAQHDSDQVVIEIVDDGRGIDPELVKRRAYERGMISQERLATIADDEARLLVFGAGFSTAETVSDLSGRGVGMDVVRNAVEKAGGRIALTSAKGAGTTVSLHLPLSMAVSRVMTVTLGSRVFGIPMDLIHETVRIPQRRVVRIKSHETFVLRDRVVPLLRLAALLDLPEADATDGTAAGHADEEVAVLVVRVSGQTIGLAISAFGEGMEVILKPLEGMVANIGGYVGTALLGDGRVLLVLDLKELIP
jgi:two-component system chemotaxis sensor kinase CheA